MSPVNATPLCLGLVLVIASCIACGGSGSDPADAGADGGGDVLVDAPSDADAVDDADSGADSNDGSGADVQPDAEVGDADASPGPPCARPRDCEGTDTPLCVDGRCQPGPQCNTPDAWVECQGKLSALGVDPGRAATAVCRDRQCVVPCFWDEDCNDGETCTDYGRCVAFPHPITGVAPGGDARAPLRAGFGAADLDFPIGVPMGGWTQRAANNDGRYAVSLAASHGALERLDARAVVLDNGERQLAILRVPMIFVAQTFHEELAHYLYEKTGRDWRDSLVVSASHTHSGPARFWEIPADGAASIGVMGIGEYSQDVHEWLVESMKRALDAAFDDLSPARLGWRIVEAYDVPDVVGRDRWFATPPFDDNRALLIRVDDAEGVPRAVMVSFGAHGTHGLTNHFTQDAPGGAERVLEAFLGERFDRFVPVMFVNQNSGSMSPAGDAIGHQFPHSNERLGWAFVQSVGAPLLDIETRTDVVLAGHTHRFDLGYELIGYDGDWAGSGTPPPFGGPYTNGAFRCGARRFGDEDYATHPDIHDLACVALHFLIHNRPPTLFARAQMTALEIDGLSILTAPGELSMELSWQMLRALRDELDIDPLSAWTWGYAQGHLLYLLPTNLRGDDPPFPGQRLEQPIDEYPDFAFSFLQGGYEPTMSPWGPLAGDYFVAQGVEAFRRLRDPDRATGEDFVLPQYFSPRVRDDFPVDETPATELGRITEDLPERVERLETVEFAWIGGDPGAEAPQAPLVTLERFDGDEWSTAILPSRAPYTSAEPRFLVRVRRDGTLYEWVARWEELHDFPTGRYRFAIDGNALVDGELVPYTAATAPFELVPTDDLIVTVERAGDTLSGTLAYPAAAPMRSVEPQADPASIRGNFRMRSPLVPSGEPIALRQGLEIDAADVEVSVDGVARTPALTTTFDGPNGAPVTVWSLDAPGATSVEVSVVDAFGNTGHARSEP